MVAYAVVVLDLFAKELVLRVLEPGRYVPLFGSVGWQLVFNPGAAFGLRLPPVIFPIVAVVLLVVIVRALSEPQHPVAVVAQGMVIGGAFGNVVDRLVRPGSGTPVGGFVVDFVAWGGFPRFNVADSAITVGVVLYLLRALVEEGAARRSAAGGR